MTGSETAISAAIGAGVVIGWQLAKSGYGALRNGRAGGFDPALCSKRGALIASLQTEVTVELRNVNRQLREIKDSLPDSKKRP